MARFYRLANASSGNGRGYRKAIHVAQHRPTVIVGAAASSCSSSPEVGTELVTQTDEGEVNINVELARARASSRRSRRC